MEKISFYVLIILSIGGLLAGCGPIQKDAVSGYEAIQVVEPVKNESPKVQSLEKKTDMQKTVQIEPTEPDISKLTSEQKHILFEGGTEPSFHNAYWNFHGTGIYVDVVTGIPLFSSLDKFDSGTGRPSFTKPISKTAVESNVDSSLGMTRTEVVSASSKGHLGHVFDDGPQEFGGLRYCINSATLRFVPLDEMKAQGYEKYLLLFTGN